MCMTSEVTNTTETSPQQDEAFRLRTDAAKAALGNFATGTPGTPGSPGFTDPETGVFTPGTEGTPGTMSTGTEFFTNPANSPYKITPDMQKAIAGVQSAATGLPPDPLDNWAMGSYQPAAQQYWNAAQAGPVSDQWNSGANALAGLATQNIAGMNGWMDYANAGGAMAASPISVGGIDRSAANVDFEATGANYDPVGVGTQAPVDVARVDPTRALEAARRHLETISSPGIRNALQAGGMGRSGAEAEALAQEGVRLELPIEQQILQSEAQANQLEAQILARQEEVQLLEQQKAKLQAQQLTATSREMAQQINGQLAGIEAQISGRLAEAEFMGNVQAQIAQRTSALQYASSSLGQLAGMNTAQQQIGATTGANLLGQLAGMNTAGYQGQMGAGQAVLQNLAQLGVAIPGMQSQQYQNQLTGAQTNLAAASLPQQMSMAEYQNYQNYILSLIGAAPLPSQVPGGAQNQSSSPSGAQALGTAAMVGSMFV